jgi:hypothetical protein
MMAVIRCISKGQGTQYKILLMVKSRDLRVKLYSINKTNNIAPFKISKKRAN